MYEEFYGLSNAPFRLSPDPAFFFGSSGHQRALAYLRYGLNQKEGFIVITGAPGTGKTTLARALLQEISQEKVVIGELSTTRLEADDVLRMVAGSFGLEFENLPKASLLKRLESFCISRTRAGYHILLLVDEAQNLPYSSLEELRMLSNFYVGKNALIQIFLLGQEQFRNSLYSPDLEQLRQRVVASSHLDPLTQLETRQYIEHRLNFSGWSGNPQISDRAFVRIFSLTKGIPRRINTFCERLLLYGALEELTSIKDDSVKVIAKELMYEVSAKGVQLSDIEPGIPDIVKQTEALDLDNISPETIDSEILNHFSDDVEPSTKEENLTEAKSEESVSNAVAEETVTKKPDVSISEADTEVAQYNDTQIETEIAEEPDSVLEDTTQIDEKEEVKESTATAAKPPPAPATEIKKSPSKKRKKMPQPLRVVGGSNGNAAEQRNNSTPETESPLIDTKPEWWDLVALSVAYYREPEQNIEVTSSKSPLLSGIMDCFKIAIGKMSVPVYLRTGTLKGITDEEIRDAIRFYVKGSLLSNTADYYRRLGVQSDASFEKIRTHYKYLFRLFQPDKEKSAADWDETFTRRINQSYGTLRSSEKRKDYDEFLTALNKRDKNLSQRIENADAVLNSIPSTDIVEPEIVVDDDNPFNVSKSSGSGKRGTQLLLGFVVILIAAVGIGSIVMQPDEEQATLVPFNAEPELAAPSIEKLQPFSFEKKEKVVVAQAKPAEIKPAKALEKVKKVKPANKPKIVTPPVKKVQSQKNNTDIVMLKDSPKKVKPKVEVVKKTQTKESSKALDVATVDKPVKKSAIDASAIPVNKSVKTDTLAGQVDNKKLQLKPDLPTTSPALPVTENLLSADPPVNEQDVTVNDAEVEVLNKKLVEQTIVKRKPAPQVSNLLTNNNLNDFVTEFSLAYEEGDLDSFMTFFTDDASTNDAANKFAIKQNYRKLFNSTDMRVIDFGNLKWKVSKGKAVGKGDFSLTVLGLGGGKLKRFDGLIKLELVPIDDEVKLKGMFHAYGVDE